MIDNLLEENKKVCVIGKTELGDPPDFKAGARGTVEVECNEGCIDLRDKLI